MDGTHHQTAPAAIAGHSQPLVVELQQPDSSLIGCCWCLLQLNCLPLCCRLYAASTRQRQAATLPVPHPSTVPTVLYHRLLGCLPTLQDCLRALLLSRYPVIRNSLAISFPLLTQPKTSDLMPAEDHLQYIQGAHHAGSGADVQCGGLPLMLHLLLAVVAECCQLWGPIYPCSRNH